MEGGTRLATRQVEPLISEIKAMKERMDALYLQSCGKTGQSEAKPSSSSVWEPAVDLLETDSEYILIADVPGMDEDSVRVELLRDSVRLRGNRNSGITEALSKASTSIIAAITAEARAQNSSKELHSSSRGNDGGDPVGNSATSSERPTESHPVPKGVTCERPWGAFERLIRLPKPVHEDGIRAELKDGVLTVVLPKAQAQSPARRRIFVQSQ